MSSPMHHAKKRKSWMIREVDEDLENMRDDCIALFLNSGMTQQQLHAAGGPTPATISKWLYKETKFPRYSTINDFLRGLGYRLAVVSTAGSVITPLHKASMPPRKKRK